MVGIRIITVPFDEVTESFSDEIVRSFCENKEVKEMKAHFFEQKGRVYHKKSPERA